MQAWVKLIYKTLSNLLRVIEGGGGGGYTLEGKENDRIVEAILLLLKKLRPTSESKLKKIGKVLSLGQYQMDE